MLNDTIKRISAEYMSEALHSPTLMEDMAAMEKYMAESYSGRIFIELLQNADDCKSTGVYVETYGNHILFANDGRPFNDDDIIAISRSGASKKERGLQIGYRGIGFKSTAYLTEEMLIYSGGSYFTFSKSECSRKLNKPIDKLPTVRIPFTVSNIDEDLSNHISEIAHTYTTVFVFMNAKKEQFESEIKALSDGYFMFLRNVCTCSIKITNFRRSFKVNRTNVDGNEILSFDGNKHTQWLLTRKKSVALAMLLVNDKVISCESEDALYHCFLPTLDKSPYPFKINADFSTDPSRKHLVQDAITNKTINDIAEIIYEILNKAIKEENPLYGQIINMVITSKSFSPINQQLTNALNKLILDGLKIRNVKRTFQAIGSFKSLPDFFENSEKTYIRLRSESIAAKSIWRGYYSAFPAIDSFIEKYSSDKFTAEEIAETLSEEDFVKSLTPQMYARIFSFVASSVKLAKMTHKAFELPDSILIPTDSGIASTKQIPTQNLQISETIKTAIVESTKSNDLDHVCEWIGIGREKITPTPGKKRSEFEMPNKVDFSVPMNKPVVAKWRSAEQQCVELELYLGNTATDVSKQNMGYDVESTTPGGIKRYIEVKLITNDRGSFSLTNNEYTAAHQYGNNYYVCLVLHRGNSADVIYINNPLQKLKFEKRIRQWEWFCENYSGEKHTIELL